MAGKRADRLLLNGKGEVAEGAARVQTKERVQVIREVARGDAAAA